VVNFKSLKGMTKGIEEGKIDKSYSKVGKRLAEKREKRRGDLAFQIMRLDREFSFGMANELAKDFHAGTLHSPALHGAKDEDLLAAIRKLLREFNVAEVSQQLHGDINNPGIRGIRP
jgi:hypothetical protein